MGFLDTLPDAPGQKSTPAPISTDKPVGKFLSTLPDVGAKTQASPDKPLGGFMSSLPDASLTQKTLPTPAPKPQSTFGENVSNFFKSIPDTFGNVAKKVPDVVNTTVGLTKQIPHTLSDFYANTLKQGKEIIADPLNLKPLESSKGKPLQEGALYKNTIGVINNALNDVFPSPHEVSQEQGALSTNKPGNNDYLFPKSDESAKGTYPTTLMPKAHKSISYQIGDFLDSVNKTANSILSVPSAAFQGIEQMPIVGTLAKVIGLGITGLGESGYHTASSYIDALPISQEIKDNLKEPLSNLTGLVYQILGTEAVNAGTKDLIESGKIDDLVQNITKDIVTEYKLPKNYYIDSSKIKDIFQTGEKISPEEMDMVKSLGLDAKGYKDAVKNGLSIEVPAEKVVTITDKPYWANIKGVFGLEPESEVQTYSQAKPQIGVRGLLEEGKPGLNQTSTESQKTQEIPPEAKVAINPELQKQLTENVRYYQTYGGNEVGKKTINPGLQKAGEILNTPEGKAIGDATVQKALDAGTIKPDANGEITVYRVGSPSNSHELNSVTYSKDAAQIFSDSNKGAPIHEFKIKPSDISYAIGGQEAELLIKKDLVSSKVNPPKEATPENIPAEKNIVPKENAKETSGSVSDIGKPNEKNYWYNYDKKSFILSPDAKEIKLPYGFDGFLQKSPVGKGWQVIESKSGLVISGGKGTPNDHPTAKKAIEIATQNIKQVGKKGVEGFINDAIKNFGVSPKYTQKELVKNAIKGLPKSIKKIAEETNILEPNVRRILGVGAKDGTFERVDKGVYVLKKDGKQLAYIETGDAVNVLPKLADKGIKADMVFLDIPYKTPAVIGGNRGIKYDYITPEQFAKVIESIKKIARSEDTPVFYMFSQAKSGEAAMQKYTDKMVDAGFKPVARGEYTKLQQDGLTRVRNMRGNIIEPEGIILFTKSGNADFKNPDLNFKLIRPRGYQTEKPAEMVKKLIEMSTKEGDVVLDPFAGSGVVPAEAIKSGREAIAIEKSEKAVEEHIKPKVEKAAGEATPQEESPKTEAEINKNMQAGFIDPGAIAEDAKKTVKNAKDFIEKTNKINEFTGNLDKDLGIIRTSTKADSIVAKEYLKNVKLSPKDAEAIYGYAEDKNSPITEEQLKIYEEQIKPLQEERDRLFANLKNDGVLINREDYTPRFVAGKGGVYERMKEGGKSIREGGLLRKTTGSFKKRTMKALVDSEGNRKIVSIKTGKVKTENGKVVNLGSRVTEYKDKVATDLGALRQPTTPRLTEFTDDVAMEKLQKIAKDLGITHERVMKGKGLGGKRAGVSFTGQNLIKTKRFTPEQVILHEIGHQIDERYNLQEVFLNDKTMRKELRKLADLRWEGKTIGVDVSKHFAKSYVRKGTEKMAVMFEAYLKNREGFRNVAPTTYKTFVNFLKSHEELKPILDIRPSLVLGSNKIGGAIPRSVFIDKNGKSWKIVDATTKEIEQNTNLTYHKNILLNELISYTRLKQAARASEFLNKIKESPQFSEFGLKIGEGDVPKGWKPTTLPQFIGYNFEPKIADALDNFAASMKKGDILKPLTAVNTLLRTSIFFNPLIHVPNVVTHAAVARGTYRYAIPSSYMRAFKSSKMAFSDIATLSERYQKMLRSGVNLMYSDTTAQLTDLMMQKMQEEVKADPRIQDQIAKTLGVPLKVLKFVFSRQGLSSKITWFTNDFFTLQAIYEREMEGMSTEEAIRDVAKHIPDYRIPSRILNQRAISQLMQNPNLTMFGAYHYGALKSYGEMIKSLVTGDASERPMQMGKDKNGNYKRNYKEYYDAESMKARAKVTDQLVTMAIIGMLMYPMVDKFLQAISGNKKMQIRRSGAITIPYNVWKLIRGKEDFSTFIQSLITPAIGTKTIAELITNTDFYTRKKLINQGSELSDLLTTGEKAIAPVNQAQQLLSGTKNPSDFLLGLGGISTPKTTPSTSNIYNLLYDRRNLIISQIKDLYSQGKQKEANDKMAQFNQMLLQNYMDAFQEEGFKVHDPEALRTYLIEHLKGKFITPPTQKEMDNYNQNQKLSNFQKLLK